MSVLLVCVGLVAGAERLRPISWSSWAGKIEREGGGANPFMGLEERAGFLDIRVRFFGEPSLSLSLGWGWFGLVRS